MKPPAPTTETSQKKHGDWFIYHLRMGWLGLFVFLSFGLVLESLHGLKLAAYLDLRNETRRLLWTLAHSHGTLLSLLNVAFAFTLPSLSPNSLRWISRCLVIAQWLLPLGFLVGGTWLYGGDPNLAIVLVPAGGFFLMVGVLLTVYNLGLRSA